MKVSFLNLIVGGLIGLFVCLTGFQSAFAQEYEVIHLGTLGGFYGRATDINELGQIVGESHTREGKTHAFFWTQKTGMIDLGTLGGNYSRASAINNSGEVVGYSENSAGVPRCFLWTENGGMIDIGTLGGRCEATDINDLGQVVGYSERSGKRRAFIWDRTNGIRDLNDLVPAPPDWKFDTAVAINNAGQVVVKGEATGILWGTVFYVIWSAKEGIVKLTLNDVFALNDLGQAAGRTKLHGHAILWENADITDLGSLYKGTFLYSPGLTDIADSSQAHGINNLGQVVGDSWSDLDIVCKEAHSHTDDSGREWYTPNECSGYPHGFIWDNVHGMRDLNNLIATGSGWTIGEASAINGAGWIAGEGKPPLEKYRQAILLRPIVKVPKLTESETPYFNTNSQRDFLS